MNHSTSILILMIFICPAFADDYPRSIVTGRVIDTNGQPLADVEVVLSTVGEPWICDVENVDLSKVRGRGGRLRTGVDGIFTFDVAFPTSSWISLYIEPGSFHAISGRDFGTAGGRNEDPLQKGLNDLGDFILASTGAVSGRILDTEGNPVSRPLVMTNSYPSGYSINDWGNDDGTYVLQHVPAGTHNLTVECDGYFSGHRKGITVREGEATPDIDFVIESSLALSIGGRVTDTTGQPLAGVRIWGWPTASGKGAGARTDANGRFSIALPQADPYVLEATLPGYADYNEPRFGGGHPPGEQGIEIVMNPIPKRTFHVVDAETGESVERFGLRIVEGQRGEGSHSFSSEEDPIPVKKHPGGICKKYCNPELHDYQMEAPGYAPVQAPVKNDLPAEQRQTIKLERGAKVKGMVSLAGCPVENGVVHLDGKLVYSWSSSENDDPSGLTDFTGRRRTVRTDRDGNFEIADLPPGTWNLVIRAPGMGTLEKKGIHLAAGETKELEPLAAIASGVIEGRVVVKDGLQADGITITIVALDNTWDQAAQITDVHGRFRFTDVAPGEHRLTARPKDGVVTKKVRPIPIEVAPGGTLKVEYDLRPFAPSEKGKVHIEVTMNGKPGKRLPLYMISLLPDPEKMGATDDTGQFLAECKPGVPFYVEVRSKAGQSLAKTETMITPVENKTVKIVFDIDTGNIVVTPPKDTK